jgi:hypothetical protein
LRTCAAYALSRPAAHRDADHHSGRLRSSGLIAIKPMIGPGNSSQATRASSE